jgi:hypothetical protein
MILIFVRFRQEVNTKTINSDYYTKKKKGYNNLSKTRIPNSYLEQIPIEL